MKIRTLQPLDLAAGGLALALVVIISVVVLIGTWEGVQVNILTADENGEIGPLSSIMLKFSEPVNQAIVQSLFSIQPKTPGKLEWVDTKTLRFSPLEPLQPGADYQIRMNAGYLGNNSLLLRFNHLWVLHVRQPQIIYLASVNNAIQLWAVNPDGKNPHRLGNFNKAIFDFDAAPNGEYLVFSALNDKQGADLWYVDRNGNSLHLLALCGADRCTSPAISPDGQQVAYTREAAPITPSMPTGAPRIWVLNVQSGEDRPLYSDPQIIGFGPSWSPDGKYITSYDGVQAVIRVVSIATGEQFTLPSATGGDTPTWSPDSKSILDVITH
jgi:dipeptidyl aminopeptidase/acylaminoacyl peptidase